MMPGAFLASGSVRAPSPTPRPRTPPAIIIASSGMATGGRVVHHLAAMLPDKKNAIVLTGYQAVGTRGRRLIDGEKQLKMFGRYVPVRAEVVADHEFSVHGDASDLIDWLRDLSPAPQTVFVTHGEEGSSAPCPTGSGASSAS